MTEPTRIVRGALTRLPEILRELGSERVLLVVGDGRRHVECASALLADFELRVFAGARRHVPEATVVDAVRDLEAHRADTVVSLGGGSATGLGKALRLRNDVKLVAVPTTYSGSELTNIYGTTSGGVKQTGRDDRVRPDVALYDVELTLGMPKTLSVTSLMNALAHPVSALGTGALDPDLQADALRAVESVYAAIEGIVQAPESRRARELAFDGAALAAGVLSRAKLGAHHQLAHRLGGRFDLDHSALHSVLLPHTVHALRGAETLHVIEERLHVPDFEASLFDFLVRAGASTSLKALGVTAPALLEFLRETPEVSRDLVWAAYLGRRPSRRVRRADWGLREPVSVAGPELSLARRVVVALHGRGATADGAVRRVLELIGDDPEVTVVAPQAPDNAWYAPRYAEPRAALGAELDSAAREALAVLDRVLEKSRGPVALFGFSQGACLALDVFARAGDRVAALVALAGAMPGTPDECPDLGRTRAGTPVLVGASEEDAWVARADVERAAAALSSAGAAVTLELATGGAHALHARQRVLAREHLLGRAARATLGGFHSVHESEALPGALPRERNSPRRAPLGLYPEQINGSGFVAPRAANLRSWLYRIRPSAQHGALAPLAHPRFNEAFANEAPEPNLVASAPLALPSAPTDFVDGLHTVGGAGSAALRRGFAVHVYAANRSMEERAFYDADGDLLLVPEHGALTLLTELGVLDVAPGSVAILPRGVRFSVCLAERAARGYVAEVFGRHFELPERGPVGANGLAEARHFRAPVAWHEDRLTPGYRVTAKFGGALYEATQDHSPYDVVAWHGNYAPYAYDLARFSPVGNSRFDHADPSIYTVLSAPLDEGGAHALDFVVFPPRWDVSEGTFRPPFFHRNVTTEFNGIIRDRALGDTPFQPGCWFVTPSFTPHGVMARSVERALAEPDASADRPHRVPDHSLWFQFESALPFSLSPWARTAETRIDGWHAAWGAYRTHFDPTR